MTDREFVVHSHPCALCGRKPALGYGSAYEGDKQIWLCHPDEPDRQDCYHLWTVYGRRPGDDMRVLGPAIMTPARQKILDAALERARRGRDMTSEKEAD